MHWEECMKKRYGNFKQNYMKKIWREKDELGLNVIYVEQCDRFKREIQKEIIRKNKLM